MLVQLIQVSRSPIERIIMSGRIHVIFVMALLVCVPFSSGAPADIGAFLSGIIKNPKLLHLNIENVVCNFLLFLI